MEISGTLRRKADMIFEKEQEYIVSAAQKVQKPKEVLYVNDHGYGLENSIHGFRLLTVIQIPHSNASRSVQS